MSRPLIFHGADLNSVYFNQTMIFGIDLGTTNSLLGTFEGGIPILLANDEGSRLTPSAVYFPSEGPPVVGSAALRQRALFPGSTFTTVKRLIGRRTSEINPADFSYPILAGPSDEILLPVGPKTYRPEEISALVLAQLKADATRHYQPTEFRAVISVPAYFHEGQRAATKQAAELAGWQVERIINEPTAAALTYGLDRRREASRFAVFDFGGGTFDLSILEVRDGLFEVLSTHGDTRLGGEDCNRALVAWLKEILDLPQPDPLTTARLEEAAEAAKIRLSTNPTTEIALPFLQGNPPPLQLDRDQFEEIIGPVLARLREPCLHALHDARLDPAELNEVLLVGGSTRLPSVRRLAAGIFQREPNTTQHPDEAIALGATIQAALLEGNIQQMGLLDVTPLSLGLETYGGLMNVLIPRNTTIPCKAGEMFTNASASQTSMRISVLQGEREMARDNWKLGEFSLSFPPVPRGQARVGVQFSIDANGLLQVLARDTATGEERIVALDSAVRVEESKVEEMVAASVDHAFEDMNERVFTEASIKAQELLGAVGVALEQLAGHLSPDEVREIESAVATVRSALSQKQARQLKSAVETLDDLTTPLADRLLAKLLDPS